jgi:hypothetical protein
MFDSYDLSDLNFLIYAMKAFESPNHILSEFDEDLKKIKYIKRLIRRYINTGNLKERLILNHIIILTNVFGVEPTVKMLFFKLDQKEYSALKTFLVFLNFMPDRIHGLNGKDLISSDIPIDMTIANKLRKI